MSDTVRVSGSPIPAEPSSESMRLLARRRRGNRAGMERFRPHGVKLAMFRAMIRLIAVTGRLPKGVGGVRERYGDGLAGRWVTADGVEDARGVLLYLHGGGFVLPPVHDAAVSAYSRLAGLRVFVPRYRLAPEHPFPAAADDVLAAYRSLLARGIPAERIRLGGDSSGGFLVAALLGDIERVGLPMPGAVLLISPLVDLTAESARARDEVSRDPATAPHFIEVTNKAYAGDTPLDDPRLDVLGADKRNWPPVLIQTGGTECLTAENEQLAESVRRARGACELQIWPGQIHAFPLTGGNKIPEAKTAREYAARFLADPGAHGTGRGGEHEPGGRRAT